ncbi:Ger(x)C family spore germination protein [Psychrobacillus soli]|uniref:Ger(X)C family spore germination protein n=1 Tax=Psychrobacillus soli TaxID=1543965 RepID=A0A544TM18_9BACI|nr:Ger(x)C family spore germination protein [Psychrobacillus soli]TQR18502.1 Ger(x)C family spore germination protein [Psychrobacillus soli]
MGRNKLIFLGFVLVVMLSGCWGQNEPERMLYTHGLGIDYEDDKFKVYVQIIDFNKVAKSEQPNPSPVQSEVGYASGRTLDEAVFKLYNSSDQKIYWGHQTFIVFSEEALKNEGMNDIIDTLIRYRETRYQIWLFATDDSVKEVLLTTPVIDTAITLSKLGDPMNSFHQSSLIEPVDIRRMIIGLNEPGHEVVIPYVKITENWETVEGKDKMARSAGVGLVTTKGFKGFINREKMFGLMWMNDKTEREEVTFSLNSDEEDVMSVVIHKIKVKVKPVVEGDALKFDIDVTMQGDVGTIPTKTTKDEIRKKAEQEIKQQIEETYKEALKKDFDIYRLSEYLYRKDVQAWKRLQQNGKVELAEDSIRTLNVKITELRPGRNLFKKTID